MSQAVDLRIVVDKEPTEYSPGETIKGYIKVTLAETMNARGIRLHLYGKGYTQVTEISRSLMSIKSNSIMYWETQHYLDTIISVWGEEDNQLAISNLTLPEGPSQFEFSYRLPMDVALPSSFEGDQHGYIRYSMIAILECPPNADYRQELPFQMQQLINIDQPSLSQMPSPLQSEITLCCSFFRPGMIKLRAAIDRSGYRSGESLSLDIKCRNLSNRTILFLRARFIGCLSINAKGHRKAARLIVQELYTKHQIKPGETYERDNQTIAIPTTPPTSQSTSLNINLTYIFQVAAIIPLAKDLHVDFPIVFGTNSNNSLEKADELVRKGAITTPVQVALTDINVDELIDIEDTADTSLLIDS